MTVKHSNADAELLDAWADGDSITVEIWRDGASWKSRISLPRVLDHHLAVVHMSFRSYAFVSKPGLELSISGVMGNEPVARSGKP